MISSTRDASYFVTLTSRAVIALGMIYWALLISSFVSPNEISNALEVAFFLGFLGLLSILLMLGWFKPALMCAIFTISTMLVGPLKWEARVLWLNMHLSGLSQLIVDIKNGRDFTDGNLAKNESGEAGGLPKDVSEIEIIRCSHKTVIVRLTLTKINGIPAGYLFDDCDDKMLNIVNGGNKSMRLHYYPISNHWYSFTE